MPESKSAAGGRIVRAAIYPSVGVSRLGNSDESFLGPEVFPSPTRPRGFYRDASGALKRQAARFRVYGYDDQDEVVGELTEANADVRWTVHVANRKAAWYQWVLALDIPEAATTECPLRNPTVGPRHELVIDAGEVSIQGAEAQGDEYRCRGRFKSTDVDLGRLETDADGRLIFVPAAGISASPSGDPIFDPDHNPNPFINADGWYDDACDGPVTAEVTVDGRSIPCDSAWVLSAPPDYAPDVVAVRSLYDLLLDLFIDSQWLDFPSKISFRRDVYPTLRRLSGLGWVNKAFEVQYGLAGAYPFEDPAFVARLADPGVTNRELRRQVLNSFRVPTKASPDQLPWPWVYGDAMSIPAGDSPRQNATISETQFRILQTWADGDFDSDWTEVSGEGTAGADIDGLPLAEQPDMLTRAALEYCLADAFHPGCEVTWPIRHLSMWRAPFRLLQRPPGQREPNYGPVLTQKIALATDGPLHAQGPGDITRWMGLPWQADTAFCRSGYDRKYDLYAPTFWPATVPNHVLTPEIYEEILAAKTPEERFAAFLQRFGWDRPLAPVPPITNRNENTAYQMQRMVDIFGSMGNLEVLPGPKGDPRIPEELMVATFGPGIDPRDMVASLRAAAVEAAALAKVAEPVEIDDTNWARPEDAAQAPLPVTLPSGKVPSGGEP